MAKPKDKPARSAAAASAAPAGKTKTDLRRLMLVGAIAIIVIVELLIIFGLRQRYIISTYRTRAKAAYASQDYKTALKYYQGLLKIAPVSVPVNEETGDTYVGLGEHETAIQHYTTALSTNAKAKGINAKIGLAHIALGQPDRALPYFDKELAIDGANPDALFYVGRHEFETGQYVQAGVKMQVLASNDKYREQARDIARQMREKAEAAVTAAAQPAEANPEGEATPTPPATNP